MNGKALPFSQAYNSYYDTLSDSISTEYCILEVGGGAHPSIEDRAHTEYTIVDPDASELAKAPSDVVQIKRSVQELDDDKKYDLIISKMVLEHLPDPDTFHESVRSLLKPGGRAIHFFACRNSLPAWFNRYLPESWGEKVLKLISNRNLSDQPKYVAHYKRVGGPSKTQISYFEELGFDVERYYGFVGHKYLQHIPLLGGLEQGYTQMLHLLQIQSLSTVALVVLRKPE